MGISVHLYKHPLYARCSNRGISETHDRATIVNAVGPFEPSDDAPPILIESHGFGILRAVPAVLVGDTWQRAPGWHMCGGAYVGWSDSRVSELCDRVLRESTLASIADQIKSASAKGAEVLRAMRTAIDMGLAPRFYGALALHDRRE